MPIQPKELMPKPLTLEQYLRNRLYSIRIRAAKKGVDFDLDAEFIGGIIASNCEYCNSHPNSELDRKDPNLGYTKANIVPACHRCNTLKSNVISYEDMLKVVEVLGWRQA